MSVEKVDEEEEGGGNFPLSAVILVLLFLMSIKEKNVLTWTKDGGNTR